MACVVAVVATGAVAQTGGLGPGLNKIPTVIPENEDSVMIQNMAVPNVLGSGRENYIYNEQQLDSNMEYRQVKEGLVMQGGQLKIVRNGRLFVMHGSFPLKNGAVVYTNGIIQMPGGSTPLLGEKNYIDFDGQVRPLQTLSN